MKTTGKERRVIYSPAMLLAFLTELQTHPDGRVYYGRALTYAWLIQKIGTGCPSERTLRRYLAILCGEGLLRIRHARMRQGMFATLMRSPKTFRDRALASLPRQLSLFSEPVQFPVEKLRNPQGDVRTEVAGHSGQKWPEKDLRLKKLNNKQNLPIAPAPGKIAICEDFWKDREPWTTSERDRELREAYGLRKYLANMPRARDPVKFDRMKTRMDVIFEKFDRLAAAVAQRARSA